LVFLKIKSKLNKVLIMKIVHTIEDLRAEVLAWRQAGETVGLVPTMGALHNGHMSLVRMSRAKTMRTCVTLFINPKQFGVNEDLNIYPRDKKGDVTKLKEEGVDLLFQPSPEVMYPKGFSTSVSIKGLGDVLEGKARPGFFKGVAIVVTKLLMQSLPDIAFFGEKDFQQLLVIRRLTCDLDIPVRIEAAPIVRDRDGLALSSRNNYLSPSERTIAPILHGTISQVAEQVGRGAALSDQTNWGREQLLQAGFSFVDYLSIRETDTFIEAKNILRPARVLVAALLGKTRLIDNVLI
jgi:pantoate--beta-alanine ligase